jgi:hypothetical protein
MRRSISTPDAADSGQNSVRNGDQIQWDNGGAAGKPAAM